MAIRYINNRQYSKHVLATISAGFPEGSKIIVQPGSLFLGGRLTVVTGMGGTSPTLTLVDNLSSPTTIINAQALGSATTAAVTAGAGTFYAAGAEFTFSLGGSGHTGGKVLVALEFLTEDGQNEMYGRSS